jgi:hypothetical protein
LKSLLIVNLATTVFPVPVFPYSRMFEGLFFKRIGDVISAILLICESRNRMCSGIYSLRRTFLSLNIFLFEIVLENISSIMSLVLGVYSPPFVSTVGIKLKLFFIGIQWHSACDRYFLIKMCTSKRINNIVYSSFSYLQSLKHFH